MVRVKNRFILLQVEASVDDLEGVGKKELERCLRDHVIQTLGVTANRVVMEMQVRFWDSHTKLCLLRVPRDDARRIRASLAFLSTMQLKASSFLIVLSTRSMHGSARTAKRALLLAIRTQYQSIVRDIQRGAGDDKQLYPISQQWQATMETVLHTIDY